MAVELTLDEAAEQLLACACQALEAAGRPACACYQTIGSPVLYPNCDCEPLTINLVRLYPAGADNVDLGNDLRGSCMPGKWGASFQLTLGRCYPVIDETGQLDTDEATAAATVQQADAMTLTKALACCMDKVRFGGVTAATAPSGGVSALVIDVSVPVRLT